jgi:uncharacterized protein (TIGR03905 family)
MRSSTHNDSNIAPPRAKSAVPAATRRRVLGKIRIFNDHPFRYAIIYWRAKKIYYKERVTMMTSYDTRGTCAKRIDLDIEDGVIKDVRFHGGCNGNLQGIAALVTGMDAREAAGRLRGIRCGHRPTSCPDQLAEAITTSLMSA